MRELAQIASFTDADLEQFQHLIRKFLAGQCVSRRAGKVSGDEEWRFLWRNRDVFDAYFAAAGWEFEILENVGAVARPTRRLHAQLFSRQQTIMTYQLLLVHHEAIDGADLDATEATIRFGDLQERIFSSLMPDETMTRTAMESTWKKLRHFGAIRLSKGFSGDANDLITILPAIELVIPPSVIAQQIEKAQRIQSGEEPAAEAGGLIASKALRSGNSNGNPGRASAAAATPAARPVLASAAPEDREEKRHRAEPGNTASSASLNENGAKGLNEDLDEDFNDGLGDGLDDGLGDPGDLDDLDDDLNNDPNDDKEE
jgi:hypothetical protein